MRLRFQDVKFDNDGNAYLNHYRLKIRLDEVMRLHREYMGYTFGCYTISNTIGLLVVINDFTQTGAVTEMSYGEIIKYINKKAA